MFTDEEVSEMKLFIDTQGLYLPEHMMGKVWSWYKRIANSSEAQPCSCQSAAGLWINALNVIKNFIDEQPS